MAKKQFDPRGRRHFLKQALTATGAMAMAPKTFTDSVTAIPYSVFESNWQGNRAWIGADYWPSPMQDWRIADGRAICGAASVRVLQLLTHIVSEANSGGFSIEVQARLTKVPDGATVEEKAGIKAGFGFGLRGRDADFRATAVLLANKVFATIDANGRLELNGEQSNNSLSDMSGFVSLKLEVSAPILSSVSVVFSATLANGESVSVSTTMLPDTVRRSIALMVDGPDTDPEVDASTYEFINWEWQFEAWTASGDRVEAHPERAFGPIFCAKYSLSPHPTLPDLGKIMKLSAQLPPLEATDNQQVKLEYWPTISPDDVTELWQDVVPDAWVSVFRVLNWDATKQFDYRLSYVYLGQVFTFEGQIRAEPTGSQLTLGALSCDNGFMFPNNKMVQTVTAQNPDMLFFAGDQLYEANGLHGIIRTPWPLAMRCYLGKYLMFCWCWRDILKDRPSVNMPDDHDMFQGNLFGHGGRPIPGPDPTKFSKGGYTMHPNWVNAAQLTQTAHLPDPYDPTPVLQNINVYYTILTYGRVSFAILEDRKWKSGFASFYNGIDPDVAADPDGYNFDHPEAVLYGQRQHNFLEAWTTQWEDADLKCILTQTPPCQLGTNFSSDLLHTGHDFDSNGWPHTPRSEAIRIMRKSFPFIVSGDQHFAALAHLAADEWEDGPCVVCVPGTSNGFPRAFMPTEAGTHGDPEHPNNTGRYTDLWGNKFTMKAVGNPDSPDTWTVTSAEGKTHNRGSGHGMIRFDTLQRSYEVNVFRLIPVQPSLLFSPLNMFPGFPKTIRQSQNYGRVPTAWLPEFHCPNVQNVVIEVWNQATNTLEYTFRLSGKVFKPHTFSVQMHRVVLLHNGATQTFADLSPNMDYYAENVVTVNW